MLAYRGENGGAWSIISYNPGKGRINKMHELPVVLDIVKVMEEEAKKHCFTKITQINLVIGELSSFFDEAVQMYFEIVAKDSSCEGARLVFEHRTAMFQCRSCGKEFPHEKSFECPDCGGESVLIKGTGNEFYIRSYEGM